MVLTGSTVVIEGPGGPHQPQRDRVRRRPNARSDDDGYLPSLWWNREAALTELLIHDADDLVDQPLARVGLPVRVPNGFHGNWADQATLDKAVAASRAAAPERN